MPRVSFANSFLFAARRFWSNSAFCSAATFSGSTAPRGPPMRMITLPPLSDGGRSILDHLPAVEPAVPVDAHVAHRREHRAHQVLVGQFERHLEVALGTRAVGHARTVRPTAVSVFTAASFGPPSAVRAPARIPFTSRPWPAAISRRRQGRRPR